MVVRGIQQPLKDPVALGKGRSGAEALDGSRPPRATPGVDIGLGPGPWLRIPASEHDESARDLASGERSERLVDLRHVVAPRDQLVELELTS